MNPPNPEHEKFGNSIGLHDRWSRWFNAEPVIGYAEQVPINEKWFCPIEGCAGEMMFNGSTWPMNPPGYHHTCDKCGFTAALRDKKYPRTVFVNKSTPEK